MNKLYSIKVIGPNGSTSYLTHRNRNSWGLRTARKHAAYFTRHNPGSVCEVEPA